MTQDSLDLERLAEKRLELTNMAQAECNYMRSKPLKDLNQDVSDKL